MPRRVYAVNVPDVDIEAGFLGTYSPDGRYLYDPKLGGWWSWSDPWGSRAYSFHMPGDRYIDPGWVWRSDWVQDYTYGLDAYNTCAARGGQTGVLGDEFSITGYYCVTGRLVTGWWDDRGCMQQSYGYGDFGA